MNGSDKSSTDKLLKFLPYNRKHFFTYSIYNPGTYTRRKALETYFLLLIQEP